MCFILYTAKTCHLCDQAKGLLAELQSEISFEFELSDILLNDALFDRYRYTIPVLKAPNNIELGWPFDRESTKYFIENNR